MSRLLVGGGLVHDKIKRLGNLARARLNRKGIDMRRIPFYAALLLLSGVTGLVGADRFTVEKTDDGAIVKLDGKLFTRYQKLFQNKPILHPVIGPTGKEMTRPLGEGDHVHHSSFWFTHGNVNGTDFWHKGGRIEHKDFLVASGGKTATLKTISSWKDDDGKVLGEESRVMVFDANDKARWIDVDIVFTAKAPVTFGKTKEGSFGVRMWPKSTVKEGGTIINREGKKNGDAWGKASAWVDYYGDVKGETLGVAILNHPGSLRHPTTWHVRTYGLFAANPFMKQELKLAAGDKMTLKHRVVFHKGTTAEAGIAAMYEAYKK